MNGMDIPAKYPKAVFFIVANEFCERFSYYGMRTILSLYLSNKLGYGEDTATTLYHTFSMCVYFFPLIGAIVSDSWLGKFKTIAYLSVVYMLGNITLSTGSLPYWALTISQIVSLFGLLLVAVGTGGIKPCVSAFGGDQFILPQQDRQLVQFFSVFYFSINAGSLISTILTPVFREDIHCFGQEDCFPLAFGVPGVLMIIATIIFIVGRPLYTVRPPTGNIVVRCVKCISHAISRKRELTKRTNQVAKEHWMDYADDEYDTDFIYAIKTVLNIFVLYIPLPVFWALYDQQGSRWTFQAAHMKGDIGFMTIKPDQIQVANPIIILCLVPLFDQVIYPALAKCNIMTKPLTRITVGLFLAAVSFIVAGGLELILERTYVTLPKEGTGELRVFNGYNCPLTVTMLPGTKEESKYTINELDFYVQKGLEAAKTFSKSYAYKTESKCAKSNIEGDFTMTSEVQASYFFKDGENLPSKSDMAYFKDNTDKSNNGNPKIRILLNSPDKIWTSVKSGSKEKFKIHSFNITGIESVLPGTYDVVIEDRIVCDIKAKLGGVYTVMLSPKEGTKDYDYKILEITEPNSVNILWLIPQYIIVSTAEVLFSVTGLEFSYSQAPANMKSVIQALWLLTTAFGNLIVIIVGEIKMGTQAVEFFVFAGLMIVATCVFMILAKRYKYVEPQESENVGHSLNGSAYQTTQLGVDNVIFKND